MSTGRVVEVYKTRLGCAVSSTVTTGATVVPVDSFIVDFDEAGGQFIHEPTGNIYDYDSADIDNETITLTSALPGGRTLTADDALYVYPRSDDYYADVAVDDIEVDTVSARVPQMLRSILAEGGQERGKGPRVRLEAGAEEWQVTELVGEEPSAESTFWEPGDNKLVSYAVSGGGTLIRGAWLKCDGTAVSRSTYASLFNAIGTTHGAGNGSTTFNIPDARSRALFGTGTLVTLGSNEGKTEANRGPSHVHSLSAHTHGINNHTGHVHGIPNVSHSGNSNRSGTGGSLDVVTLIGGTTGGSHDHGGANSGGGHAHDGATGIPSTGDTGSSAGGSDPMSYYGFHVLIHI